jgi:parvulin-like peptidyl-prolyl isomerase
MILRRSHVFALLPLVFAVGAKAQAPSAAASATNDLNLRFANGIVAVAEDKIITIADVQREISPLLRDLQSRATSQEDFNKQLEALEDSVIQDLIDRVLIIKDFRKDEKKHIPEAYVDKDINDTLSEQFDNDRSKFLAYLRARGQTIREYRKEVEENIIYNYMRQNQRKSQSMVSPVRIETFYNENKDRFYQEDQVHMRMIQLTRTEGVTDAELLASAKEITDRLKAGEKFEDLAKEYSKDAHRSKGGDWGPQKRSDLNKEYSDPLFALKKGEYTAPILLPEGCFILFAEDRKYAGIKPLDEAREEIEHILQQQMTQNSQERWLERLRRNGYIKHY